MPPITPSARKSFTRATSLVDGVEGLRVLDECDRLAARAAAVVAGEHGPGHHAVALIVLHAAPRLAELGRAARLGEHAAAGVDHAQRAAARGRHLDEVLAADDPDPAAEGLALDAYALLEVGGRRAHVVVEARVQLARGEDAR